MADVGDYRAVCSCYEIDIYTVTSYFEKHNVGPSRAFTEYLAASPEQLTVAEFWSVLRNNAKRGDIAILLEEHHNQEETLEKSGFIFNYSYESF